MKNTTPNNEANNCYDCDKCGQAISKGEEHIGWGFMLCDICYIELSGQLKYDRQQELGYEQQRELEELFFGEDYEDDDQY